MIISVLMHGNFEKKSRTKHFMKDVKCDKKKDQNLMYSLVGSGDRNRDLLDPNEESYH